MKLERSASVRQSVAAAGDSAKAVASTEVINMTQKPEKGELNVMQQYFEFIVNGILEINIFTQQKELPLNNWATTISMWSLLQQLVRGQE